MIDRQRKINPSGQIYAYIYKYIYIRTYICKYIHIHINLSRNYPYSQGHFHVLKGKSRTSDGAKKLQEECLTVVRWQNLVPPGSVLLPEDTSCYGGEWREKEGANQEQSIKRSQWEPGIETCIQLHEGLKTEAIFSHISQRKLGYGPETNSPLKQISNKTCSCSGCKCPVQEMRFIVHPQAPRLRSSTLTLPCLQKPEKAHGATCSHSSGFHRKRILLPPARVPGAWFKRKDQPRLGRVM